MTPKYYRTNSAPHPPPIIQVGNIPFCGFSWTPAQHQVQIEKVPLANFGIGRPTVLSTEPLFQARNSDVSPWAHKWRGSLHFYPQASHIKNPSVVAACPDPQLRCSASSACANLAISRAKSQRESLWSCIFQCTTLPRLHSWLSTHYGFCVVDLLTRLICFVAISEISPLVCNLGWSFLLEGLHRLI